MLRRSRLLTQQVEDLELLASNINQGWEPEPSARTQGELSESRSESARGQP